MLSLTFLPSNSEDYPYKEVLDLLANRCLADRTNAWTDTDHTCYTVYTAGSAGFLNILPVYMDHILHPLLRYRTKTLLLSELSTTGFASAQGGGLPDRGAPRHRGGGGRRRRLLGNAGQVCW